MNKILDSLKKMNKLPMRVFGIFVGMATIVGLLNDFNFESTDQNKCFWLAIFILLWLFFSVSVEFILYYVTQKHKEIPLTDSLLEYLEKLKNEGKDFEIIRWGLSVSRPLWLTHEYEIRRRVSEYVEDAVSGKPELHDEITRVLIDEAGWTLVELGLYDDAILKIEMGITIAREHNNWYMVAKGSRHLFALYTRKNKLNDIDKYINDAFEAIEKIEYIKEKNELLAENYFAQATFELKSANNIQNEDDENNKHLHLEKAKKHIQEAEELYKKGNNERGKIKIQSRKGDILLALKDIEIAKLCFETGKEQSEKCHLNKHLVRNLIGLGDYWQTLIKPNDKESEKEKKRSKAKQYYQNAFQIAKQYGIKYECEIVDNKLKQYE
jgi:tetratricopeptide (TPR) repeat protein